MSDYTAAGASHRSEATYGLSVDNAIVTGPDAIISNFNLFHLKPSFASGYRFQIGKSTMSVSALVVRPIG